MISSPTGTRPGGSDVEKEALETLSKMEAKAVVPEEVFVKKYLPLFMSDDPKADFAQWLEVAGNVYREVDVVKGGEVLFTVPPLLLRHSTNSRRHPRDSFYEVMDIAVKKTAQNPHVGRSFMRAYIENRIEQEGILPDDVRAWNEIFVRYGYDPIVEELPASDEEEPKKESNDDLFDEGYETL